MKIFSIKILFVLLFLLFFATLNAQDSDGSTKPTDSVFVMTKSPWGAVGRSAIIPGWGQFYNESYLKIPVVWGVFGWFTYLYVENNKLYKKYKNLYTESLNNGSENNNYKDARNTYRDERDKYALMLGLSYLLNLVDAYVDAQLFDFNVIENPITRKLELGMSYRF